MAQIEETSIVVVPPTKFSLLNAFHHYSQVDKLLDHVVGFILIYVYLRKIVLRI